MPRVTACLITLPNPNNHTGPDEQEIFLNAREGLLRVLDLITDDVTDDHLLMSQAELEEHVEAVDENTNGHGVRWTFVPVMDLNIIPDSPE